MPSSATVATSPWPSPQIDRVPALVLLTSEEIGTIASASGRDPGAGTAMLLPVLIEPDVGAVEPCGPAVALGAGVKAWLDGARLLLCFEGDSRLEADTAMQAAGVPWHVADALLGTRCVMVRDLLLPDRDQTILDALRQFGDPSAVADDGAAVHLFAEAVGGALGIERGRRLFGKGRENSASPLQAALEGSGWVVPRVRLADAAALEELKEEVKEHALSPSFVRTLTSELAMAGCGDPRTICPTLRAEFPWMDPLVDRVEEALLVRAHNPGHLRWIQLPPLLALGSPGVGKTRFARRLAELAGLPSAVFHCVNSNEASSLVGTTRSYTRATPSWIVRRMAALACPNPLLVLDEIEKVSESRYNGSVWDAVLALLEPETARRWEDAYLQIDIDLSAVSWFLTANSVKDLPAPLMDRVEAVRVDDPGAQHVRAVLPALVRDIAALKRLPAGTLDVPRGAAADRLATEFDAHRSFRALRRALERHYAETSPLGPPAARDRRGPDPRRTAVHEAGHVVAGARAPVPMEAMVATVVPEAESRGHVVFRRCEGTATAAWLRSRIIAILGGQAAERLVYGDDGVGEGAAADLETAGAIAQRMVRDLGMSDLGVLARGGEWIGGRADAAAQALLAECQATAQSLVAAHRREIESLAAALEAEGTLDAARIRAVVARARPWWRRC